MERRICQFVISFVIGVFLSFIYYDDTLLISDNNYGKIKPLFESEKTDNANVTSSSVSALKNLLLPRTRLLCFITTAAKRRHNQKAILETWAPRCDTTLFIVGKRLQRPKTRESDRRCLGLSHKNQTSEKSTATLCLGVEYEILELTSNIKIIHFDMIDSYAYLWQKTKLAFQYIVDQEKFDWVLKVDDDSFVIVENLRLFLNSQDPADPSYFGLQYKTKAPKGFNSGGSGYVMSRCNAAKFVHLLRGTVNASTCPVNSNVGAEDVLVAQCLAVIGIFPNETRDEEKRFRFFSIDLPSVFQRQNIRNWFWEINLHPLQEGFDCCSDTAISFHYVTPAFMRVIEYLVYYLHPFSSRKTWREQTLEYDRFINSLFDRRISIL